MLVLLVVVEVLVVTTQAANLMQVDPVGLAVVDLMVQLMEVLLVVLVR